MNSRTRTSTLPRGEEEKAEKSETAGGDAKTGSILTSFKPTDRATSTTLGRNQAGRLL
jgi:hypothetical protein